MIFDIIANSTLPNKWLDAAWLLSDSKNKTGNLIGWPLTCESIGYIWLIPLNYTLAVWNIVMEYNTKIIAIYGC